MNYEEFSKELKKRGITSEKSISQILKRGGKMKNSKRMEDGGKSPIKIKKENKGKFTDYCGGKVTQECINRGKNSSNPTTRKRATFADNARKWKHQKGGKITSTNGLLERLRNLNYGRNS